MAGERSDAAPAGRAGGWLPGKFLALVIGFSFFAVVAGAVSVCDAMMRRKLAAADRLWDAGDRPAAAARYRRLFEHLDGADRDRALGRLIDHEAASGNDAEARRLAAWAASRNVEPIVQGEEAKKLCADARRREDERKKAEDERRRAEEQKRAEEAERARAEARLRAERERTDAELRAGKAKADAMEEEGKKVAWFVAEQVVTKRLRSPGSASFGGVFGEYQDPRKCVTVLGLNEYRVDGWVDAKNAFNATVRTDFSVRLRKDGDTWRVVGTPEMRPR